MKTFNTYNCITQDTSRHTREMFEAMQRVLNEYGYDLKVDREEGGDRWEITKSHGHRRARLAMGWQQDGYRRLIENDLKSNIDKIEKHITNHRKPL